jgi:hypothetical protein
MDMHYNKRELQISIVGYLHEIIDEFPFEFMGGKVSTPAPHLFEKDKDATPLDTTKAKAFHQVVAKVLWAATHVRPDLLTILTFQVNAPDENDMKNLVQMIAYICDTVNLPLTLGMED